MAISAHRLFSRWRVDHTYMVVLAALVLRLQLVPIEDADFGWHLKTGELVAAAHWPPLVDDFSYTQAGRSWVAYSWLAEWGFWTVAHGLGFNLLIIACGVLSAAITILAYRWCRATGASTVAALVATFFGALASLPFQSPRPGMLSFFFFTLFCRAIQRVRQGSPTRLWLLVPLSALWANVHVFFTYGILWLWVAAAWGFCAHRLGSRTPGAQAWPRLALVALGCTLATLATPYGLGLWDQLRTVGAQGAQLSMISELQSPDFHGGGGLAILPFLLLLVVSLAYAAERPDGFWLTQTVVHLALGLYAQRNLPYLSIVATPLLARSASTGILRTLAPAQSGPLARPHLLANVTLAAVALAAACIRIPTAADLRGNLKPGAFPTAAVDFLRQQPPLGRMVNSYNWGGFLIHELYPTYRVSMDSRSVVYGTREINSYLTMEFASKGWQTYLNHLRPDFVLWERHSALANALAAQPEWVQVYADDVAVIFVRKDHPLRATLHTAAADPTSAL